jgi:hypothetical protein
VVRNKTSIWSIGSLLFVCAELHLPQLCIEYGNDLCEDPTAHAEC